MNKSRKKLKKYGYPPESLLNDTIANDRTFSGNYCGENIKRLKLTNCHFKGAKFNDAAVTGSNFRNCTFEQCDMDQGDFEFCDFFKCEISSDKPIAIAFDNSNFIETKIHNLNFYSSTFSNAFFEDTEFKEIKIINCTLEGATFQRCSFEDIDFGHLNLDFVDFRFPHFVNSILPMSQIVYTYGLLQYLMTTDDNVYIIGKNKKITAKEYITEVLPALLESYLDMDEEKKEKIYFPLINILLALNQIDDANYYLDKALNMSAFIYDFRMMKHYCKLVSLSEHYTPKLKKRIYQKICGFFKNSNIMTPWQLKDFSRNIGDMKYILSLENNFPSLVFSILTNTFHTSMSKIGLVIADIFSLSDKYNSTPQRDIRIELGRNSPVIIVVQFTESVENIFYMLNDLIMLTCYTVCDDLLQEKADIPFTGHLLETKALTDKNMKEKLYGYAKEQLSLTLLDFHVENWKKEYNSHYPIPVNFVNTNIGQNGAV